ncbi:14344_t:CDS:1, partial [Gigaspora rosea]
YEEADSTFNKILEMEPNNLNAICYQAEIHKEQKNYEKAIEVLTKGLENASGNKNMIHLYVVRGDIHRLRKEYEESLKDLDEAISLNVDNMEIDNDESTDDKKYNTLALCYRGSIHRNNKNYDNALKDLDGSLKNDPRNIFALCERGAVYRDKGNFKDAWNDIENALKLSEENEDYLE